MSYIRPSVLVYQDLVNSGGVLNSTPDLETCIIGPAYNVLDYVPGSTTSQVATAALSTVATTGSINTGLYALTVVSTAGFNIGDSILVVGAGASGATLQANITNISGNIITLDTAAGTTVTGAAVSKTGKISNSAVSNTFNLAGQKPGQTVDTGFLNVWLNNIRVQTQITSSTGYSGYNVITVTNPAGVTGGITATQNTLTVNTSSNLVIGDTVTVAGAGVAGALLTAIITNKVGTTLTLGTAASTTVVSAVVTKVVPINLNSSTNTLRAEPGDQVVLSYTNNLAANVTFTTTIQSLVTSSGLNGTLSTFTLADMLPADVSYATTASALGSTTVFTVTSPTGFTTGDTIVVTGVGVGGADLVTTVTVAGSTFTLGTAAAIAVPSGTVVRKVNLVAASIRKVYNNQQLAATRPITGGANFDTSNATTLGQVTINPNPEVSYGLVISGDVYIEYRALRTDLVGTVLTFENVTDLIGQMTNISDLNPIGLAASIALANTIGRVRAITVGTNDLAGYQAALATAEGERLYFLVPLTQDTSIISTVKAHCQQMSTPENASWRVGIVNTAIPTTQDIGQYSASFVNANGGANTITLSGSNYVLTASNATFISDGVTAGDIINITAATPGTQIGTHQVLNVVSNQQLIIQATATATAVSYYVTRTLTKTQAANSVAATSTGFNTNRVWYIQPDLVGVTVNGVVKYLPGYYLCAGLAGMGSGFPVQQGFTNIGVAGIVDLKHSNFYFSKTDLNNMAGAGVCLFVQETQGGIPYVRHALTTDISVLEYREQLVVKNWDFLSYFYYDKLKSFIGSWNIVDSTINIIRQVITAASELIKSKKLPKIGAPLVGYKIVSLAQNQYNKDNLDVYLQVAVVYPLNYLNVHLQI